jgi:phenylacetic acid degradation operon negative regulatory protein
VQHHVALVCHAEHLTKNEQMSSTRNTNQFEANERPLTARSVLVSALLGEHPPRLPVSQLVRIASLFGINENRARVALSRMAANNEVSSDDSVYQLIGPELLARQARQSASRTGSTTKWTGEWVVAVIQPGASASERSDRRLALAKARLAEFREGVWVRPDNIASSNERFEFPWATVVLTKPTTAFDDAAPRLWNLDAWNARAATLWSALGETDASDPKNLATGFVLSAACLRHFQADPLLPDRLLPPDWRGAQLRSSYTEWDKDYRRVLSSGMN